MPASRSKATPTTPSCSTRPAAPSAGRPTTISCCATTPGRFPRLQALLQVGDDACLLKNLSSVSTIEVNREPVGYAQERALNTGDIIRIGPYVLRAERDDDRAAPVVDMPAASGTSGDPRSAVPETAARAHGEKGAGNRLWGLLQERLVPRGKAVDADTRSGTAHRDAGQPASRNVAAVGRQSGGRCGWRPARRHRASAAGRRSGFPATIRCAADRAVASRVHPRVPVSWSVRARWR